MQRYRIGLMWRHGNSVEACAIKDDNGEYVEYKEISQTDISPFSRQSVVDLLSLANADAYKCYDMYCTEKTKNEKLIRKSSWNYDMSKAPQDGSAVELATSYGIRTGRWIQDSNHNRCHYWRDNDRDCGYSISLPYAWRISECPPRL